MKPISTSGVTELLHETRVITHHPYQKLVEDSVVPFMVRWCIYVTLH